MEWIILFIVCWILFFLTVDWKVLKLNLWCGLMAMVMQVTVDHQLTTHHLYIINNNYINVFGSSLFFITGPVFVMGTLLAQYHPVKKWSIIIHWFVFTILYSFQEFLLLKTNALQYLNWHFIDSIGVNLGALGLLSWFTIVILQNGRERGV